MNIALIKILQMKETRFICIFRRIITAKLRYYSIALLLSLLPFLTTTASATDDFCWNDSYGRGAGELMSCSLGQEKNGLICYPQCKPGYTGVGPVCWQQCADGQRDDGTFCFKGNHQVYGNGVGYPWNPLSSKSKLERCNADNPVKKCYTSGFIAYPYCKSGYHSVGALICSKNCAPGQTDIGISCAKDRYGRGAGEGVGSGCKPGYEKNGLLCYPRCRFGFKGVGPVCRGKTPPKWVNCGLGSASTSKNCAVTVFGQVSSVIEVAANIATLGATYAAKEVAESTTAATKAERTVDRLDLLFDPKFYVKAKVSSGINTLKSGKNTAANLIEKIVSLIKKTEKLPSSKNSTSITKRLEQLSSAIGTIKSIATKILQQTGTVPPGDKSSIEYVTILMNALTPPQKLELIANMENDEINQLRPEEITQTIASVTSMFDPTGVSGVVATYSYPKCSNIFDLSRSFQLDKPLAVTTLKTKQHIDWKNTDNPLGHLYIDRDEPIVNLSGSIHDGSNQELLALPDSAKPAGNLVTSINQGETPAIVKIGKDGKIRLLYQYEKSQQLSMTGIHYWVPPAKNNTTSVQYENFIIGQNSFGSLGPGMTNNNHPNGDLPVHLTKHNNEVVLTGRLRIEVVQNNAIGNYLDGRARLLATIPLKYAPKDLQVFTAVSGNTVVDVDVTPQGQVLLKEPISPCCTDISLTGINWNLNPSIKLTDLDVSDSNKDGWRHFRLSKATASLQDGYVTLGGVVEKPAKWSYGSLITTLPSRYRPSIKYDFNALSGKGIARIEVNQQGEVRVYGGKSWVSLSGIKFPSATKYIELYKEDLANQIHINLEPYGGIWANPLYTRTSSGLMNVVGMVKSISGHTLPGTIDTLTSLQNRNTSNPSLSLIFNSRSTYNKRHILKIGAYSNSSEGVFTASRSIPLDTPDAPAGTTDEPGISLSGVNYMTAPYDKNGPPIKWSDNLVDTSQIVGERKPDVHQLGSNALILEGQFHYKIKSLNSNSGSISEHHIKIGSIPNIKLRKKQVFNVGTLNYRHYSEARLDIDKNGNIWYDNPDTVAPSFGEFALGGIILSKKPQGSLPLVNGWKDYHDPQYQESGITRVENLVILSGMIQGDGKPGVIAILPMGYRPSKALLFTVRGDSQSLGIEIYSDGRVILTQQAPHGWLSLSGIIFPTKQVATALQQVGPPLPPTSRFQWKAYSVGQDPNAFLQGNIVKLSGLIKNQSPDKGSRRLLGHVPYNRVPKKELFFRINNYGLKTTSRINITDDGNVYLIGKNIDNIKAINLSDIIYPINFGIPIELTNGWIHYDLKHVPNLAKEGNLVVFDGMIKGGNYGVLGMIPKGYRPVKHQIVMVATDTGIARIDILPTGKIVWITGPKTSKWISFSGITYSIKPDIELPLKNEWVNPERGLSVASVSLNGSLVSISGILQSHIASPLLAIIPKKYRPVRSLAFSVINKDTNTKNANGGDIVIMPNGKVVWMYGDKTGWLSLDGITYKKK